MKVELCSASIEALKIAETLDIDRVELCQCLEQGGLTPSLGFIESAMNLGLETHVLIRPRSGGFCYSEEEIQLIIRDVLQCKSIGAHGVVVGVLDQKNQINQKALDLLVNKAGNMDITFHRAFDDVSDHQKSIDLLVESGIKRILSSGLARNVDLGLTILKSMVEYSKDRIEIMPGGGVNLNNIGSICSEINPHAIHFSGTEKTQIDEYSMFSEAVLAPSKSIITKLMDAIN